MPQIDLGLVVGPQGPQGQTGQTGATGPEGPQGPAGLGLPSGGTAGDVLVKQSSTDYSTSWSDEVLHPVYEASFTIATSAWAVTSPYTYTWTDSHVTASSSVSVYFDDSATHAGTPYIEFEKVSGGIQFTALAIPSAAIPVHVKIFRARASSLTDLEADMVATDAISGAENVEEALGSVGDSIASLNSKITTRPNVKTFNINESKTLPTGSSVLQLTPPSSATSDSVMFVYLYSAWDNVYYQWNPQAGSKAMNNQNVWTFNVNNMRSAALTNNTYGAVVLY